MDETLETVLECPCYCISGQCSYVLYFSFPFLLCAAHGFQRATAHWSSHFGNHIVLLGFHHGVWRDTTKLFCWVNASSTEGQAILAGFLESCGHHSPVTFHHWRNLQVFQRRNIALLMFLFSKVDFFIASCGTQNCTIVWHVGYTATYRWVGY